MKKLLLLLYGLTLFFSEIDLMAQESITVIDATADGIIKFAVVQAQDKNASKQEPKSFLKRVLKTGTGTEFYLYKTITDELGMVHEKYQQSFNGIKVEFCEFIIHKDKSGNIVSINGDFAKIPESFNIKPALEFSDALDIVSKEKKIKQYRVLDLPEEKSVEKAITQRAGKYELVIIKGFDGQLYLTYKVNLMGDNIFDNFYGYIDCNSGKMISELSLVLRSNSTGVASTRYSGSRNITSDSNSGVYRLRESSRNGTSTAIQTFNYLRNPAYSTSDINNGIANAVDFSDNDNNWTSTEFDNINRDNAALDAHWGAEMSLDYFHTVHSRLSFDNNNGTIKSYVHVRTRDNNNNIVGMDNSFWQDSCKSIFYGDGLVFGPTVSLDFCGHEFGHAVCKSSVGNGNGLNPEKESGALGESLSDIWAACIEQWATLGKQTWLLGEDLTTYGFRSMSNPTFLDQPDTYLGTFWVNPECESPSYLNDFCGVHTNSGVGNFWFFLLSQGGSGTNDLNNSYNVSGIGIGDAAKIVYSMETSYLSTNSKFSDARNASILAATDLFGINSCQVKAVTDAWYAVGVGNQYQYSNVTITVSSSTVCSSGTTVTVNNVPTGRTVTWDNSSNINLSTVSGNSATFTPNGQGQAWIQPTINFASCGSVTLAKSYVWASVPNYTFLVTRQDGYPVTTDEYGNLSFCPNTNYIISISPNGVPCYTTDQTWNVPSTWTTNYISGQTISINTNDDPYNGISVDAKNCCNEDINVTQYFEYSSSCENYSSYLLTFTPNPSYSETIMTILPRASNKFDNTTLWDLEIYDSMQRLKSKVVKLKGDKHTISTTGWRNGIYVIRVRISGETIAGKLIVKN